MLLAESRSMNPKAEELKRRTFKFASHADFVVKIGHVVEEADESCYWLEVIRAAKITSEPTLDRLLGEAGELTAVFSQSQLTARANAGAYATARKRHPILNKAVNS